MSYIGAQPPKGQYRKLRNFEASFDGILTSFQLEVDPGGAAYYVIPGSANQLIVSLGGVIQEPNVDYTVSSSQITFTTAPAGGLNCFIIQCGDALNIGVPSDGTVSASKLNPAGGLEGQTFVLDSSLQFAFAYVGGATGGGGGDQIFFLNDQNVTNNYAIPAGKNAMTAGPVTINSGVTVTIPSGASWVVV